MFKVYGSCIFLFRYQSLSMASSGSGKADSREHAGRKIIVGDTVLSPHSFNFTFMIACRLTGLSILGIM